MIRLLVCSVVYTIVVWVPTIAVAAVTFAVRQHPDPPEGCELNQKSAVLFVVFAHAHATSVNGTFERRNTMYGSGSIVICAVAWGKLHSGFK
jgi:hypothetical protein